MHRNCSGFEKSRGPLRASARRVTHNRRTLRGTFLAPRLLLVPKGVRSVQPHRWFVRPTNDNGSKRPKSHRPDKDYGNSPGFLNLRGVRACARRPGTKKGPPFPRRREPPGSCLRLGAYVSCWVREGTRARIWFSGGPREVTPGRELFRGRGRFWNKGDSPLRSWFLHPGRVPCESSGRQR